MEKNKKEKRESVNVSSTNPSMSMDKAVKPGKGGKARDRNSNLVEIVQKPYLGHGLHHFRISYFIPHRKMTAVSIKPFKS